AEAVQLTGDAMLMLLLAAFVEAFWSSNGSITPGIKYAVGVCGWLLVAAYLSLAGRDRVHGA
ncbi:MAG: stage II sporulation protein M, partial [Thiohalocapsa sp.]